MPRVFTPSENTISEGAHSRLARIAAFTSDSVLCKYALFAVAGGGSLGAALVEAATSGHHALLETPSHGAMTLAPDVSPWKIGIPHASGASRPRTCAAACSSLLHALSNARQPWCRGGDEGPPAATFLRRNSLQPWNDAVADAGDAVLAPPVHAAGGAARSGGRPAATGVILSTAGQAGGQGGGGWTNKEEGEAKNGNGQNGGHEGEAV